MDQATTPAAPRTAFSGICTLVVVGLLIGASLSGTEPGFRELGSDGVNQRHAVRHITETVARAVRTLVGEPTRPALLAAARPPKVPVIRITPDARLSDLHGPPTANVRVALLDLPPPPASA